MTQAELIGFLTRQIENAGSQAAWAKKHGVSPPYVYAALIGMRPPGKKILDALGYERVITYRRKTP